MNTYSEIELTTKRILENLKKVNAPTVDINYYHNGTPSAKVPTLSNVLDLDSNSRAQFQEEKFID